MNKIILEKLIYENYLKTALTSVLFIEITLIIIYFSANNSMTAKSLDFILNDIKKSVYISVNRATSQTEHIFKDIENLTIILQNEHQNFFKYLQNIDLEEKPIFKYAQNGMYYKTQNNGGSSVVLSKDTKLTKEIKRKLINTEVFDATFKTIVDNNEMVVASYFNSYDNLNRYYPYIKDSYTAFASDIKMKDYNFYFKADLEHNQEKKAVWTDVYLDPAGLGWMLSSIVPIYNNGFLEGVSGIDITVETIIKKFLNFKLPYDGSSFLIDKKGNIIAMSKGIEKILELKYKNEYIYKTEEKIKKTIFRENKFNIIEYKDKNIANKINRVLANKEVTNDLILNNNKYLFFADKIEKTSWYVISLIDENNIVSELRNLENYYKNLGYIIIFAIILFYLMFFIFLYNKAVDLVNRINGPLKKIIKMMKNLGTKKDIEELLPCGIVEIDILSDNFNNLVQELDERTKKLVYTQAQKELHKKLANTDSLTGVYNRRFLNDFSSNYLKIAKRENKDLSLLIIDIDDFKNKNDTYGHKTGDIIIKKLVSYIKNVVRDNDIIVRYGGDEFIVVLPNTNIKNAKRVAIKLISYIKEVNQLESKELYFTITIGVSTYKNSDKNVNHIINRADESLYEAKKLGKNRVI
jgi:diguanylate cyclase (GGDEF)-like protein